MFKLKLLNSLSPSTSLFPSLDEAVSFGISKREKWQLYDDNGRLVCESDGVTVTNFLTE